MSSASVGHRLAELLAPVVEATGLDLEGVAVSRQGRGSEVRVLVDRDGGVSLDDVATVSQAISTALDMPAADAVLGAGAYVLEVSSPGVDRPLVEVRQWRRAAGRLVRVGLTAGGEITGRIIEASADGVRFAVVGKVPGAAPTEQVFGFEQLGPGRVQVEFNRPAAPAEVSYAEHADHGSHASHATGHDLDLQGEESR
jgi:ribosome maturation factor RimP